MRINRPANTAPSRLLQKQQGVTLMELIVFIVVISIALVGVLGVYQTAVVNSADPVIRMKTLELAQARLDAVMALPYADPNTETGGDFDDVDDYHNITDTPAPNYSRLVTVAENAGEKLVTVQVTNPSGDQLSLAAYRVDF